MEEGVSAPILSRKELRKQKLMEYLTAKGKLKPAKSYVYDGSQERNGTKEAVMGKENKIPADGVSNYSKVQTARPSQTSPRRAFGVTKSLQKVSTQTGGKNALHPASKSTGLQPKPNRNHVLARTYTVTSSKSNLTAVKQPKKQPNAQTQVTAKPPSNTGNRVGAKSTSKSSLNSNTAVSYPVKGLTVRLSVGPFVKTKTGLIPAMIQPRNTKSNSTQPSASAARATITTPAAVAAKRTHSNTTSLVPQRSAAAISATRRTENKVPVQIKIKSKPVKPVQLTSEGQLSSGLRQTSSSFKCKAEPQGRVLTNKAAFRFENGSRRARPGAEEDKTAQAHKTVPQTSSRTASRFKSRAVTTVKQTVSTERGGKTETSKETFSKIENSSRNILTRPKVAARMSQTAPQPCRTISLTNRATDTKTPRVTVVPQTEGKKLTAAQEERLKKLQEWREAKGISYKRPPMPVKAPVRRTISVPQPYWASMKAEDDAHSVISAVDRSLADCIKLLAEGCPADQVKGVLSRLPAVSHKFAKYWICQARLMEQEGNLDVLPMFEEAVRVVLEPVDELRTVVFDIMKKKDEAQVPEDKEKEEDHTLSEEQTEEEECNSSPMVTPKPVRVLISGEKGDSSAVKYKITLTPGGPLSQQAEPVKVNGQEVRFFTPVRRSVRIERASLHYPAFLQDHDACVTSYGDLISEEVADNSHERSGGDASTPVRDTLMYIYRENEALKDKVFVEFECDDGV